MKRFSRIINKIASVAAAAVLALGAFGCSAVDTADTGTVVLDFARSAADSSYTYDYSNISLKYKADGGTSKSAGSWSTKDALDSAVISIPAGTYTFTLGATIKIMSGEEVLDTDTYTAESEGTVTANEATELSFTLKRASTTTGSDSETITKGEENADGSYTILSWLAKDYTFTEETNSTVVSGTFGDVTVSNGKGKSGNKYIQLSTGKGTLTFKAPKNTSKIVVNATCGSKNASSCSITLSGSTYSKEESAGSDYADIVFEPVFEGDADNDAILVTIKNSDSSRSLNVASVTVYAPTAWTTTTSASASGGKTASENAEVYETTDVTVDLTADTEGTVSGSAVTVKKAEGWLNSAYVIFEDDSSKTYTVTCDGTEVDSELLRHYSTYKYNENSYNDGQTTWTANTYSNVCRVDVLGLAAGEHKIVISDGTSSTEVTVNVLNHDRSGYAFSGSATPGAYKADGTLKDNAKVVYVTKDNAKTVSIDITNSKGVTTTYTGLQNILRNAVLKTSKDNISIDVRVIGKLSKDDLDAIDSGSEGLQIKNNFDSSKNYVPITIEGVGHDATLWGFGFLIRDSQLVEVSNLALMCFMDDGISLDTNNQYTWVHNVDIFYGSTGGDSDQAKGDGSLDVKGKSSGQSYGYNHFWDSGKCSLCGMKSETSESRLTYHHNWFDHSDSRHPRIRTQTVHIYNNYFDGNAKYGVGVTMGASAFVEQNIFRNPHDPMMSSKQGTDATGDGTFSGENGGWIKAFNNLYFQIGYNGVKFQHMTNKDEGWTETDNDIDCYIVDNRTDTVPSTLTTVAGGTTYNNFDTSEELHVAEGSLTEPAAALPNVIKFAGRHNPDFAWTFDNATEDSNYGVISELKSAVVAYETTGLTKVGK